MSQPDEEASVKSALVKYRLSLYWNAKVNKNDINSWKCEYYSWFLFLSYAIYYKIFAYLEDTL